MKKITEIDFVTPSGKIIPHIFIENEDGSFISIIKEFYNPEQYG